MAKKVLLTLSLFLSSSLIQAQDRAVVVKNLNKELMRTAHRLGVSPEQVRKGRSLLRKATALALELAGSEGIQQLGQYWLQVDRQDAAEELTQLIRELKEEAGATADTQAHGQLTRNARSLADRLSQLRPEAAEQLLEDWPEAPQLSADELARNASQERRFEERRLVERIREDVDASLAEMREQEKDGPLLSARSFAINEFFRQNRVEDANALFDETFELLTDAPPTIDTFNSLRNLLFSYGQFGDEERAEKLVQAWASMAQVVELPDTRTHNIGGVDFTSLEYLVLATLRSLSRAPELSLRALEYFPDLNRKLEPIGGVGGFFRAQMQASRDQSGQNAGQSDLEEEIVKRMRNAQRPDMSDPDGQAEELEAAMRMLPGLHDPETEAGHFVDLAIFYFGLQGELTPELRRQGLDYVRQIREQEGHPSEDSPQQRSRFGADRVEANIYGMWLWSDQTEASQALASLSAASQFRAIDSYLKNLTQPRFRTWRP